MRGLLLYVAPNFVTWTGHLKVCFKIGYGKGRQESIQKLHEKSYAETVTRKTATEMGGQYDDG